LCSGLALLTDTTEAGLSTIARELQHQQAGRGPAPRSASRAAVSRRVVAAARKGDDLTTIAGNEMLSESEVRLHLQLATARQRPAGADAGV
jgi:predicted flap endonuclease-1-like 5' DNA nuclease